MIYWVCFVPIDFRTICSRKSVTVQTICLDVSPIRSSFCNIFITFSRHSFNFSRLHGHSCSIQLTLRLKTSTGHVLIAHFIKQSVWTIWSNIHLAFTITKPKSTFTDRVCLILNDLIIYSSFFFRICFHLFLIIILIPLKFNLVYVISNK
jgi:hypothetical protein